MRWSQTHIYTIKEAPSDAEIPSHRLMVRAGMIKKLAPGLYSYGPLALRALRKFEGIIREELDKRGCIEILMPMVHPKELWDETGRWSEMGSLLLKFKNRNDQWFCLAGTHEEAVTDFVRHDIKSYRDLPKSLYQVQTKYRDEIRPRFGLMRCREFIMKDAYSFDLGPEEAGQSYKKIYGAYEAIFNRLGLDFRVVQADPGNIGGIQTHEFQLLAEAGEDALLVSDSSDFAANVEVCPAVDDEEPQSANEDPKELEKFSTPGQRTIADLAAFTKLPENQLVKTLFFSMREESEGADSNLRPVAVLLRGSDEINPIKLKNALGMTNPPLMLTDAEVKQLTGASPGSCGPVPKSKGIGSLDDSLPVFMDKGVEPMHNFIVGANEEDFHLRNVNHGRDFKVEQVVDLRLAKEGDLSPDGKGRLKAYRGIEVGHVFNLGTKYSESMSATYLNSEGKAQPIHMGCYGIGVSRTVQACIEQSHDEDGIIWPKSIAPYDVHICCLDPKDETVLGASLKVAAELEAQGLEVLVDDRDERPGVKFKDADLLGFPIRIVMGKRGLDNDQVEVLVRRSKAMEKLPLSEVSAKAQMLWQETL